MRAPQKTTLGRRGFFRLLGTGAAAGAITPIVSEVRADSENTDEKHKARYRETDEVKTFYRVNRYPS